MCPASGLVYPISCYDNIILALENLIHRDGHYLNTLLLRAKKMVNDISHPIVRPTVWHVDA
jgi:hypothetical protein